ncbi:Ig-like domain-containing protein [Enterobacter sp. 186315]
MTIKLSVQQAGQKAHNVALSGITNSTIVQATPGARFAIDSKPGDITSMIRQGDKLIINTSDGKAIQVDHFFGAAGKDMKSLTIDDSSAAGKKYVLGDEKIYQDGQSVTSYSPEQLRQVVSGNEYYAQQATKGESEVDPLWVALGLGGVALVGGTIALLNNDDDDDDHSSKKSSDDNGKSGDKGGDNTSGGDNGNNGGNNSDVLPSALTMDVTNGSTLRGTTDTANATVMVDTTGDGKPNYTIVSDEKGNWSVDCAPDLADKQQVTAWVIDANGNKIDTTMVVDYHAPELASLAIDDSLHGLSGVTDPNSVVSLDINGDGKADYVVKSDAKGNYRFDLGDASLVPGTSALVVTDTAGNTTSLTLPVNTAPVILGFSETPDGTINLSNTTSLTSATLHGMGEPGSEVQISNNGVALAKATVAQDGTWQVSLDNLPKGDNHFTANSVNTVQGKASTDSNGRSVTISYTTSDDVNVLAADTTRHIVQTDAGLNTTQTITRAMPDGGYLIAWAQPENAASQFYDIKVNIYNANGSIINTMTIGQQGTMDGYANVDGLEKLNNFDVAVSPVDGAITVFYAQGTKGDLDYTGTSAVYERFSSDGNALTDGPQLVASSKEIGGLGGLLDATIGDGLSDLITGAIDCIWNPIESLLQPLAGFINVDIKGLADQFVHGLSNCIASVLYGAGTFGANIVQMEDGSVVFVGTRYAECLDTATLVDRMDVKGFITEFFTNIGLIGQGNFVSDLVEPCFNAVMNLLVSPIESIADSVLEWVDLNLGADGAQVWNTEFTPSENGSLVQSTEFQYVQGRNKDSGMNENGFISGSDKNGLFSKMAEWVFGSDAEDVGASVGLNGTQVSESTYAVIWQKTGTNTQLDSDTQPKAVMALVDAKTGKHITSEITLTENGVVPKIVTLADGTLLATWVGVGPQDGGDIYSQRLAVSNNAFVALSPAVVVNTLTEGTQGLIGGTFKEAYDLVALNNGGYIVTWTSTDADGTQHLQGQLFDMTGVKIGNEIQLDSGAGNTINDSSITALSDGGYVVNWSESNDAAHTSTVMYTVFNQDGSVRSLGEENPIVDGSSVTLANDVRTYAGTDDADVVDAHLASATVNSGAGDDRVIVDATLVQSVDGGAGHDTVVFSNAGTIGHETLEKLHNVDTIDLNASNGANTLTLSYEDVVNVSNTNKLFISGGKNDSVDLDQNHWTQTATGNKDGQSYNLYTYDDDHHTQLWIQNNIQIV